MLQLKKYITHSKLLRKPLLLYRVLREKQYKRKNAQVIKTKPFGISPDSTVYIIRRRHQAGFFSNFFFVLGHIVYANQNGWMIAVDMENYPTLYNEDKPVLGTRNAWEYFFEQPSRIELKQAYCFKHQILSSGYYLYENVPYYEGINRVFPTREIVETLSPYIDKHLIIKPQFLDEASAIRHQWDGRVVGVHIRGTDMNHTPNHPVPPLLSQYFTAIDRLLQNSQIDHICLCTDENAILEQMKNRYGDKLVFTNSFRSTDGTSIHKSSNTTQRDNHRYLMGKEVLIDALVLSKCDYLICGHSNVPYAAIVLNRNQYIDVILLENADQNKNTPM